MEWSEANFLRSLALKLYDSYSNDSFLIYVDAIVAEAPFTSKRSPSQSSPRIFGMSQSSTGLDCTTVAFPSCTRLRPDTRATTQQSIYDSNRQEILSTPTFQAPRT
eukprot:scaffold6450_cov415-Prasinococcus_capsulatus_cf.AAC.5